MRPRNWKSFWTILASIAGLVGAAAAVYPLLNNDQVALLTLPNNLDEPRYVYVETISEPIVFTGSCYIKKGPWWYRRTLRGNGDSTAVCYILSDLGNETYKRRDLMNVRVGSNEQRAVSIDVPALNNWAESRFKKCSPGELEIGLQVRSKAGLSWISAALPFCAYDPWDTKN